MPQNPSETSENDEPGQDQQEVFVRQDLYVVFTHERELKNIDQVRIKISQFTGIVIRLKSVTLQTMENLIAAIDADTMAFQLQAHLNAKSFPMSKKLASQPVEMCGLQENVPISYQTPTSGIINLRFEECSFASKAVQLLKSFLIQKQSIETFFIQKVEFQDPVNDFRHLMEGVQCSHKIRKAGVIGMLFDEEQYGKTLYHCLSDSRQLREFDVSNCEFFHPKSFFDMCQSLISDKSRVIVLKMKGIHISNLEGKVLQFVLMKNKSMHTIDLSNCKVDSGECLEYFLQKLDRHSNIRHLILDSVQPDLSSSLEILGDAIYDNTKLEVLIMRENKLKWVPYSNFWDNIQGNTSLQKINLSKTDLSDRVVEKMCSYLVSPGIKLVDLDLSRNLITDVGLGSLSEALMTMTSIKYLNLSQNNIKDIVGLQPLVNYLSMPTCTLIELSLMGNKINGEGVNCLADFLKPNTSLKMLDISKNLYSDQAFYTFAQEMGPNATLTFLDISKSKDLNDEGSLTTLAQKLAFNTHLQTLDLTAVRVRKPFLKQCLEPSLQKNITLKYVLGKLTPDIIDEQLNINIQIQTDVEPNYVQEAKPTKSGFDFRLVDECNSLLNMKGHSASLFEATFKFMKHKDVRQMDLTGMDLMDGQLYQLSNYLSEVPNLRSLILNDNTNISDDGLIRIAQSLVKNRKLAHLSIQGCPNLTDESLKVLFKVLTQDNMMLNSYEFNENQFDVDLGDSIKLETELNRAIQESLKPSFYLQNVLKQEGSEGKTDEVVFVENAPVHLYLSSAIKCWRIAQPIVIQIENQQLTDTHVVELCNFLKDRNMIINLNLRRNLITNEGARSIIDWITNYDTSLTHLDISRNRITRAGAQAFLEAMQKTTRIIDFQIAYGNPIPLDLSLAIGYEIVANNQIQAIQSDNRGTMQFTNKVTLTSQRYELIDRGPLYMRCAIKSVELCRIRHLSLPDNMLGLDEAKMLAQMIKLNPPLTTLNLEINNLDSQCARLIGEALESNDNLQVLNISKNKLSDLGISYLLQSLIKSRLTTLKLEQAENKLRDTEKDNFSSIASEQSINGLKQQFSPSEQSRKKKRQIIGSYISNQYSEQQQQQQSTSGQQQLILETEQIERCEMGQLKVLDLSQNRATLESYKVIATLLQINPSIVLIFDDPVIILQPQLVVVTEVKPIKIDLELQDQQEQQEQQDQQVVIVKNHKRVVQSCINSKIQYQDKQMRICKLICCYKPSKLMNMTTVDNPSLWLVINWRLHYCRQSVTNFSPEIDYTLKFNAKTIQNVFVALMIFTQCALYILVTLPYYLDQSIGYIIIIPAVFLAYIWILEQIMLITSKVKVSIINPYLQLQVLAGLLNKSAIISLGIMGGLCFKTEILVGLIFGILALCLIILDQYWTVIVSYQCIKQQIDRASVLPLIERSQKLAEVLQYKGLLIMFKKVTLLPSNESEQLSQKITYELNPDLIKPAKIGLIAKVLDSVTQGYRHNAVKRHLFLINIPLLLVLAVSLLSQWFTMYAGVYFSLLCWLLDLICLMLLLCDRTEYSKVSINTTQVYQKAQDRKNQLHSRYTEVLMREKDISLKQCPQSTVEQLEQSIEQSIEHGSYQDTNNNNQAPEQGETTIPIVDLTLEIPPILSPKQTGQQEEQMLINEKSEELFN